MVCQVEALFELMKGLIRDLDENIHDEVSGDFSAYAISFLISLHLLFAVFLAVRLSEGYFA